MSAAAAHDTVVARPERLVGHGGPRPRARGSAACALARSVVVALLGRITRGTLEIVEDGELCRFGEPDGSPHGRVELHDPRAWYAVATEGSVGLGRGYIEGWWHSDDPVGVVRVLIVNLGAFDALRGAAARFARPVLDPLTRVLPRRGRRGDREDIASHYDIGNEFFAAFLDETLTYSSAVFGSRDQTLAEASRTKYDRLLTKLGVGPGHRVLEIGTGWGGFAVRAAGTTGCRVTTTTISEEQYAAAVDRVGDERLSDRVTVERLDWRDLRGRHDRIVSIEMIEAVDWRDYDRFFATLERCLEPDGMIGLQAICVPGHRYESVKRTDDFIKRFVFPGGQLPSLDVIGRSMARAGRLQIIDVEDLSAHYAETLSRWRARFDEHCDEIVAAGPDERFARLWRFYLAYCEAAFHERHCTVAQIIAVGPDWRPDGLALRPV